LDSRSRRNDFAGAPLAKLDKAYGAFNISGMNSRLLTFVAALLVTGSALGAEQRKTVALTDGKTFSGWVGDTNKVWRIEQGAFVGGSLREKIPQNEFLRTTRGYTNFILRLKVKLLGTPAGGFINGGVQVRSQPAKNPPNEMVGYQCDMGEGWWGALYDESRRNKVLVKPDPKVVEQAVKKNDWNEYLIRCEGKRLRTWLNGEVMIDYTESDDAIEQFGLIGVQVHSGGPAEASYKEITIEELP
jgi:3-keto-disaccharide hydrolase